MNPILIIGDTHLHDRFPGYLDVQINSIFSIYKNNFDCNVIIFLGDVFERRKPSPLELNKFKELLYVLRASKALPPVRIYILKGNHDMERKSDDSPTSLTLFDIWA